MLEHKGLLSILTRLNSLRSKMVVEYTRAIATMQKWVNQVRKHDTQSDYIKSKGDLAASVEQDVRDGLIYSEFMKKQARKNPKKLYETRYNNRDNGGYRIMLG